MRIAVWKTGHEIADTVADACLAGLADSEDCTIPPSYKFNAIGEVNVAYGILRGCTELFRESDRLGKPWVHLDRGYFNPRHFDGKYRISLRGTQQTSNWPEGECTVPLAPWRGFDESKPVLVVPPTDPVFGFFNHTYWWYPSGSVIRKKGFLDKVDFMDFNYVHTFNSSLGWQALQAGIPCVSDPTHSMVGSWYHNISLADLSEAQYADRNKLFGSMEQLQLTLTEIREGKLWPLMEKLLECAPANLSRLG